MDNFMNKNTVWSKIIGGYLLANGLYAFILFGYLIYSNSTFLNQGPIFIFLLNNLTFPTASAVVGYFLLIKPSKTRYTAIYLLASIFGIGYGQVIYWSGHGLVISVFLNFHSIFFAINITAIVGIVFLVKHVNAISKTSATDEVSVNSSTENR